MRNEEGHASAAPDQVDGRREAPAAQGGSQASDAGAGSAGPAADRGDPLPPKAPRKQGCCVHYVFYVLLFFSHWFGDSRFDRDKDGDFDPEDVQAYMDEVWDYWYPNSKEARARQAAKRKKAAAAKAKAAGAGSPPGSPSSGGSAKKPPGGRKPGSPRSGSPKGGGKRPGSPKGKGKAKAKGKAKVRTASPQATPLASPTAAAAPAKKQLTLEAIKGRWLVGEPGSDFVVAVEDGGRCIYDGRYADSDHDLYQGGSDVGGSIVRRDGWQVDPDKSHRYLLTFVHPDHPPLEWRRIAEEGELTLKALAGEWRVVMSDDVVTVEETGWTLYNGDHIHGDDIVMVPTEAGPPEIKRGEAYEAYVVDQGKSSKFLLVWVNVHDGTVEEWRRPRASVFKDIEEGVEDLGEMAVGAVDGAMGMVENVFEVKVEGEAYEDKEFASVQGYFSRWRPSFVLLQCSLVFGLWVGFSAEQSHRTGVWTTFPTQKAGLDSQFPGMTDLRLLDEFCNNFRFQVWRLFTYQFTHVGINHVVMNCVLTLILGIPLEALMGFFRLAGLFYIGVFGGACCYGVLDARSTTVGMSGGCYALVGIHFAELALNWWHMKFRRAKLLLLVVLVVAENVNHYEGGVSTEAKGRPGSSSSAHLGGFITGFIAGALFGYDQTSTLKDLILKIVAGTIGGFLAVFCATWIFTHENPYPVWEWGNSLPSFRYQQMFSRRCLGVAWRCVRCSCVDHDCLSRMAALVGMEDSGWHSNTVDPSACATPWYAYQNLPIKNTLASVDFASIPFSDSKSACALDLR